MFFNDLLFADEELGGLKKKAAIRAHPPLKTLWMPPKEFPNLSGASAIAIDTETKDPELTEHGPGWARGKGHIVGISVAATDNLGNRGKWYFPMRHEVEPEYNMNAGHVLAWARDAFGGTQPKVGANLIYDLGWLQQEGVYVNGELHDVQYAEALLNESGLVNLEHLGQKYLGTGKDTSELYEWSAYVYGGKPNSDQRANIYRCPGRLVGTYAEQDAVLPLDVIQAQWGLLQREGLADVYRMECDLIRLLLKMRFAGVSIDLPYAHRLFDELGAEIPQLYAKLNAKYGTKIESVNSGQQLATLFDAAGVRYPRTAEGNPSFQKKWLEGLDGPLGADVNGIREIEKIRNTFVGSYLLNSHVNGKVYCSFNPLRGDDNGTRSGRYSSSDPNLQNIPVRTKLGKRVRQAFIPDAGHAFWLKQDYSQIEYRFLAHFAVGEGADEVRRAFNADPKTDYHELTQALVKKVTGMLIERKPIKNINFGLLYGMGKSKLARQLGVDSRKADEIFAAYHAGAPYVSKTMAEASTFIEIHGYMPTILGRRSRFDVWEPIATDYDNRAMALPYEAALRAYGPMIKRAHGHKAINRKLQGSAADMMKLAMWTCDKAGIFDYTGVPRLTVHDELDHSVIDASPERAQAYTEMRRLMESCMQLRVPVLVEDGVGANWGAIE